MKRTPTEGQLNLIRNIERRTGKKFYGNSFEKAHNYIKRFGQRGGAK